VERRKVDTTSDSGDGTGWSGATMILKDIFPDFSPHKEFPRKTKLESRTAISNAFNLQRTYPQTSFLNDNKHFSSRTR
jgi:hypothetical protein